jgi:hypothetical protein
MNYDGKVPCCGIYCGGCLNYMRDKNKCFGAENHCKERRCGIYICCVEKKSYSFCFQCKTFPCNKFKKFADTWQKLGQNLWENHKIIKEYGTKKWLNMYCC